MTLEPLFGALPLGAVRPAGWLRAQMVRDLTEGFAGCLDKLTERAATDLFARRIESSTQQFAWWDAETRGNWLWGYTMMAFLADLPEQRARAAGLMAALMNTRDPDGYLGIYSPASRYAHGGGENGELWAQSRALLALLAYHELSGDAAALDVARAAVDQTLSRYGPGRPYFQRPVDLNPVTGMTHGLCYVDVLRQLFDLTGDPRYRDFASWLYADFSSLPLPFPNDDLASVALLDPQRLLCGHAVHTAEHLRAVLVGASDPRLVESALRKLRAFRTPSGALVGDENIHGLPGPDAGYEYCTLTELLFSLVSALRFTGDAGLGDWAETLAFNAAQGARLADGKAVSYLSSDTRLAATADRLDSYSLLGGVHGRFKFSPTHEDVACCCNPNAVRLLPHYVSRMWLRAIREPGLIAALYGPCTLRTQIKGIPVTIVEGTCYPFEERVRFTVQPERPLEFALYLRRPAWADAMTTGVEPACFEDGYLVVRREWVPGDELTISFGARAEAVPYPNGAFAVRRGPLQYALPARHTTRAIRTYPLEDFHDLELLPGDPREFARPVVLSAEQKDLGLRFERDTRIDEDHFWACPPLRLWAGNVALVPLGCTPLRRADFLLERN